MTDDPPCCCGRLPHLSEPLIINDYCHEPAGKGFCGPKYKHELRDLTDEVARLTAERDRMAGLVVQAADRLEQAAQRVPASGNDWEWRQQTLALATAIREATDGK